MRWTLTPSAHLLIDVSHWGHFFPRRHSSRWAGPCVRARVVPGGIIPLTLLKFWAKEPFSQRVGCGFPASADQWAPCGRLRKKKEKKSTFHLLATEASGGDKRRSTFSTSRCHYAWKQQRRSRFIFEKTNLLTKLALRRSGMTSRCLLSSVCVTGRVDGKRPLSKRWQRRNIWNWWRRAKSNKCFSAYPPVAHVARTQSVQLTQQRVRDEKLQFPMNQFHMVFEWANKTAKTWNTPAPDGSRTQEI